MPVAMINGKRILFMHVPKAAGSSVTAFLEAHGEILFNDPVRSSRGSFHPRHQPADIVAKFYSPADFDYAFMICRHPVDRLVSEYRYQRMPKRGRSGSRLARLLPFSLWLRVSLYLARRNPGYRDNHFRPQHEYVFKGCEVFRLEDGLEPVLGRLREITGLSGEAREEMANRSPSIEVRPATSDVELIARRYARDFAELGYALPGEDPR